MAVGGGPVAALAAGGVASRCGRRRALTGAIGSVARSGRRRRPPVCWPLEEESCAARRRRTRSPCVLAAVALGPTLVVVPGVDDARVLGVRLRRAGLTVAVVPRDWAAAAGGVDVVIGTRLAAWAPVPDLAAVVVLDEHDEALQEERVPTWHARDVAIERARRSGVPCLLVSPVPSLAALQAVGGDGRPSQLPSRNEERAGWPILEIVDRSRDEPWKQSLLSSRLLQYARDPGCVVVCVLNAPGRARRLACRSCRALQRCERCQAAVAQTRDGQLRCARCGLERPVVCQACGSSALVALRPGVTALAEQVGAAAGQPGRRGDGGGCRPARAVGHPLRRDGSGAAPGAAGRRRRLPGLRRRAAGAEVPGRRAGAGPPRPGGPPRRPAGGRRARARPDPPAAPRGARCRAPCRPRPAGGRRARPAGGAGAAPDPRPRRPVRVRAPRSWPPRSRTAGAVARQRPGGRSLPGPGSRTRPPWPTPWPPCPRPAARVRVEVDPPRV